MKKTIILLSAVISFTANAQWSLTGNAGTNPGTNFIGTTDNQPLVFKTNNQEWIKLTTTGRVIFQNIDGGLGWNNNLFLGGGNDTATGLANTAVGLGALTSQSTGIANSAFGVNAGRNISTASSNTAIGTNTMMNGNIGNANTAVGGNALSGPGTLTENTAIGMASMARYTASPTDNASGNTALGFGSLGYIFNGIGNVGLGKRAMGGLLSGVNNIAIGNMTADNLVGGNNNIYIGNVQAISTSSNNELNINNWIVGNNGTIGIGQFTNQLPADGVAADGETYKLFVKDGIKTEKIKVDISGNNGWADYVFEKNYQLMPLNDLDQFISKNGHLPEVPTTKEAIEKGIELKEMNILLLKKIEELTLYTIEQQKRIEALEKKMK
ncbi:hypothetical protein SAMN05421664_0558 [Chryseobacterium soldanellicola]|uniref:Chaperone of endosialidase n=1 Tax=Chryseobacterium soldanellicola TaxID=311333 RepID=A0A1H0Y8H1_9FLAO|nr:hypothetical protein [Chryseobacterium soldanellicola]SDQ11447.1 hypothetical protein SAMN05421664_0558 [Chryseobacterium soldanellicola]